MGRKLISLVLTCGLVLFLCSTSIAGSTEDKTARHAEKVKSGISKLGTGSAAHVEVKLQDKTKLKGYVREINDSYFVIVDEKTGAPITVDYAQVKQVKGNNLSKGAKIAIGIGIIALALLFAFAVSDDRP